MKFKLHIDGREHQIEAKTDGTLVLDGEAFEANSSSPSADRRMVQVSGETYEIRVVDNCVETGIAVLELAGERVPMTVTDVAKSMPAAAAAAATVAAAASSGPATGGASAAPSEGATAGSPPAKVPEEVKDGIWAPVPGKIVDVFVKPGDVVEEGTAVLVLEAMKMENELHAPHRGTVATVTVKKGDQAEKGQLLVAFA